MVYDKTIDLHQVPINNLAYELDILIENSYSQGHNSLRIITGKGRGVLRNKVLSLLKKSKFIARIEYPLWGEGDEGAIAVWLVD